MGAPSQTTSQSSQPTLDPALRQVLLDNVNTANLITSGILPTVSGGGAGGGVQIPQFGPDGSIIGYGGYTGATGTAGGASGTPTGTLNGQPYTPPSTFTAGFTPDQERSFDLIRQIAANPLTAAQLGGDTYGGLAGFNAPWISSSNVSVPDRLTYDPVAAQAVSRDAIGALPQIGAQTVSARDINVPAQITAQTVSAPTASLTGVRDVGPMSAATINAPSPFDAAQIGRVGDVTAGTFAGTNLTPYQNAYASQVLDPLRQDLQTQTDRAIAATRQASRASGAARGSNPALAEMQTREGLQRATASALSPVYQDMFRTSAGLVQSDLDRQLQAGLANQGTGASLATAQANLNQDAARTAYTTGADLARAQAQLQQDAAGQNFAFQGQRALTDAANQQGLTLASQDATLRAGIANQGAGLQAGQINTEAALRAATANQDAGLRAGIANQGAALTADQTNVDALLRSLMANQSTGLAASQTNAENALRAGLANQQAGIDTGQFNIGTALQTALSNRDNDFRVQQANQGAQISSAGVRAAGAAGLAGANQGAQNSQVQGAALLGSQGQQQQDLATQRLRDAIMALQIRNGTLFGALPSMTGQTTTSTQSGGGSGIAGLLGGAGSVLGGLGALGVTI